MPNDSKLIKCFNCGQTHRLGDYGQNTGIICTGCGRKMEPLIFDKICEGDKRGFLTLLGYFSITALIGVMGSMMVVHGWNFLVTFTMLGGVVYLIGKIFMSKYKIIEIEEYLPDKIAHDDADAHCSSSFDSLRNKKTPRRCINSRRRQTKSLCAGKTKNEIEPGITWFISRGAFK